MKTDSEIKYEFRMVIQNAEELEEVATGLKRMVSNEFGNLMQMISISWRGEAANVFLSKGDDLMEKIVANAKSIENMARTIRIIAQKTYDAEMDALRIAMEREYGAEMASGENV